MRRRPLLPARGCRQKKLDADVTVPDRPRRHDARRNVCGGVCAYCGDNIAVGSIVESWLTTEGGAKHG